MRRAVKEGVKEGGPLRAAATWPAMRRFLQQSCSSGSSGSSSSSSSFSSYCYSSGCSSISSRFRPNGYGRHCCRSESSSSSSSSSSRRAIRQ